MMHVSRIVYPLHSFSSTTLLYLFEQLDRSNQTFTIKRLSNPSPTLSGNEIYLEGKFELSFLETITNRSGNPIAIRFELEKEQISTVLQNLHLFSCYYISKPYTIFIGVTMLPTKEIMTQLQLSSKELIVQQLFQSSLVLKIKPYLTVKPKGIVYSRRSFIEFVYPLHPPQILADWLSLLSTSNLELEAYKELVSKSVTSQRSNGESSLSFPSPIEFHRVSGNEQPNLPFLLSRALKYSGIANL